MKNKLFCFGINLPISLDLKKNLYDKVFAFPVATPNLQYWALTASGVVVIFFPAGM